MSVRRFTLDPTSRPRVKPTKLVRAAPRGFDDVATRHHDDRWGPQHLAVLLEVLESGAPLAATGCVRIDPAGRVQERSGVLDTMWPSGIASPERDVRALQSGARAPACGRGRRLEHDGGWSTAAAGHARSFLHGLGVVPTPSGPVLALPTAPVSDHHNSRIRELLQYRHRAQLSLVRELVRP